MGSSSALRRLNNALPSSMRYGQFRYYWMVLLAQVTGHQMLLNFTMGWLMYDLTGEEQDLAYLGLAIALPALALNLVGGVLADRLEPKRMVTLAQATSATVVTFLAVLVLMDRAEVWHVLATAVIIGAVSAIDQPSRSSIFPRLVLREHILNAVAMENIVWNAVRIGAPAVAGLVIENWEIHTSMFCTAAAFYLMSIVVSLLNLRERPPAQGRVVQQVREGFRYVREHTIFSLIMLLTFCNSRVWHVLHTPHAFFRRRGLSRGSRSRRILAWGGGRWGAGGHHTRRQPQTTPSQGHSDPCSGRELRHIPGAVLLGSMARGIPARHGRPLLRWGILLHLLGGRHEHTATTGARPA